MRPVCGDRGGWGRGEKARVGKRRVINQESLEDVLGTFARIVSEGTEFEDDAADGGTGELPA